MDISYLDEDKALLKLAELSPRQSGFSYHDLSIIARECSPKEIRDNELLLDRSVNKLCHLLTEEWDYIMDSQEVYMPKKN